MCARAESGIGRHLHVQGLPCRCGGGKLRDGPGSHDPAAQPLKHWNVEKLGVEVRQVLLRVDLDQLDNRLVSIGERRPILDVRRCDAFLSAVLNPC